ncbi:ABC transporter ATP-binding protein [Leuconostoc mesenteroides subsp. dextranicum]|jgi:putative ABC transport system ATP-binding protein|uniref:ABC transporter ATP-binding protein n=1 Tax=Leuconostoc mesenteroides TaxID=1245 RepID=UPI000681EF3B|nr:ATP-binding cassette domain-containing protein [Leuconostoc mesenteroides]MDN6491142.1 ATP-binding cassette domain-containing protein [Leuconostoc sp.]KMY78291.1 ABC transporter ATP-binding protein [Leuconostoc mesenteroides subsp. mesenteroides]KMY81609.1 ABC transporter ATP-binding protein [Leuconostoc mesenteroides subsp. dextranicum]MBZ1503085.1 ATP-binding cassette domain-containing protein [Leuconostoc mesenteroides]MBZ1506191.1 ATP-binding cassette domain-containing protein [Leuconos
MTNPVFSLKDVIVTVGDSIQILKSINFDIYDGDFITVLGTNGAGKSTLFNTIAGNLSVASGEILHNGNNIAHETAVKRTNYIARVFQDPKMGTAPRMTVAENLLLAEKRGSKRTLRSRGLTQKKLTEYAALTKVMGNNLDRRLNTATGDLSGGQRQALSFLMATRVKPELLLLDEHTAALDPKTSEQLMLATNEQVTANNLTALMITHNLADALKYGNRLIILNAGNIVLDVRDDEKKALDETQILKYFVS